MEQKEKLPKNPLMSQWYNLLYQMRPKATPYVAKLIDAMKSWIEQRFDVSDWEMQKPSANFYDLKQALLGTPFFKLADTFVDLKLLPEEIYNRATIPEADLKDLERNLSDQFAVQSKMPSNEIGNVLADIQKALAEKQQQAINKPFGNNVPQPKNLPYTPQPIKPQPIPNAIPEQRTIENMPYITYQEGQSQKNNLDQSQVEEVLKQILRQIKRGGSRGAASSA